MHTRAHTHTHARTHTHAHTRARTHARTRAHARAHTVTHTHAHPHTVSYDLQSVTSVPVSDNLRRCSSSVSDEGKSPVSCVLFSSASTSSEVRS